MRIVIAGGSLAGLSAALFLARSGCAVTVLEADDSPTPSAMPREDRWFRRGTPHSSQAHNFGSGFLREYRRRAPDLIEQLVTGGSILRTVDELLPPTLTDRSPQPGDEELEVLSARRPFVEWTLRRLVLAEPAVTCRLGVHVRSVTSRLRDGIPHVTGVVTSDGEHIDADVVVDACGRRSQLGSWLKGIGARPPLIAEEPCNQVYVGRYYLLDEDATPPRPNNGFVVVSPLTFGAVLIFPGDNGVLQCAAGFLPEDAAMKPIREPERFHRVISSMPATKPWIEQARPIGDVVTMGSLRNSLVRIVTEGTPHVTGLHAIGDARCTTNPQYGRGVGHAAIDAGALVDVLAAAPDDPVQQTLSMDAEATRMLEPSFRDSALMDRVRGVTWAAGMRGEQPRFDPPELGEVAQLQQRAMVASATDATFWRAATRCGMLLDPPGGWRSDAELLAIAHGVDLSAASPPALPTRADVLAMLEG